MPARINRFASTLILFAVVTVGQADNRTVIVNGEVLNALELALLDGINCGIAVPNGNYWLDWATLAWGYAGDGQQGTVGDCASQSAPSETAPSGKSECEAKYTFYEDRMCYCHGMCGL